MTRDRRWTGLAALARAHGLQTVYTDAVGVRRRASTDSIRAVLGALGVEVSTPDEVAPALRERQRTIWTRSLEPVLVAWGGRATIVLRVAETLTDRPRYRIVREDGSTGEGVLEGRGRPLGAAVVDGVRYVARRYRLPDRVPPGYHRLTVTLGRRRHRALLIAAPPRAHDDQVDRWGVFLPLYALHTDRSWGVGDFTDLAALTGWVGRRDGQVVSTLPLLAAFLGRTPFEPSPYLPVSRHFWNELFVDVTALPELEGCPSARRLVASEAFQRELTRLRATPLVAYREVMTLKRRVLERLARQLTRRPGQRREAYERWVARNPLVTEYATFRARGERLARRWSDWPDDLAARPLSPRSGEHEARRYHLYAQWVAETQLDQAAADADRQGGGLYLDYPLGVHADGFDVWRFAELFARDASAGAPPDDLFAGGQNWTAPPLRPDAARADGYRYFRQTLTRHLTRCGTLRIDHVMALHRLYWIPRGFEPTDGVYVHAPADELYAILCLESDRHSTRLVGENLGTVPRSVNRAMDRHGLARLYVGQFNLSDRSDRALRPVPPRALACVDTHDTPTFQGFVEGADLAAHVAHGHLTPGEGRRARRARRSLVARLRRAARRATGREGAGGSGMLRYWLTWLARSRGGLVIVNLEDLWLEPDPQNMPGTTTEHPNWRRRARHPLEAFDDVPGADDTLREIARGRSARRRS